MNFSVSTQDNFTILSLSGDVDMQYSPVAREQILKHLTKKENVLIDMSAVTYIDSSGVASLVEGYQLAKTNQLEFGLIGVSNKAMQVLKLARLDQVFLIYQDINARLKQA